MSDTLPAKRKLLSILKDLSPWKPGDDDTSFYIDDTFVVDIQTSIYEFNADRIYAGNCYRTTEEAEYVANKMRVAQRLAQLEWSANRLSDDDAGNWPSYAKEIWIITVNHETEEIVIRSEDEFGRGLGAARFRTEELAIAAAKQLVAESYLPDYKVS